MRPSSRRFYHRPIAGICALLLCLSGCARLSPLREPVQSVEPTDTTAELCGDTEVFTVAVPETEPPLTQITPAEPLDTAVATMYITTEGGLPISSKVTYQQAILTIVGAPQEEDNVTLYTEIRGRGHSSFSETADLSSYDSKNSYRLKLSRKANLLGVGDASDRDWLLISCKYDASALRNYLVWDLAERMGTIPFVPACTWVNLYMNGDYRGMYVLCEHIEVASDRVAIDDSPSTDPDEVGYLLEYDLRGNIGTDAVEGLTYFYLPDTDENVEWVIKSETYTTAETAAVRAHLLACHEAILSGDRERMETLIDIPSFVDMFILQELAKNPDVGCSSFFVQRDRGGKLCLTAPWDFDFSFGTYSESVSTYGLVADGAGIASHPWFEALAGQPWFMREVEARMEAVTPLLEETVEAIQSLAPLLTSAADLNDERWSIYGEKFALYVDSRVSVWRKSYGEHVDFLIQWTSKRWIRLQREVHLLTE